MKKMKKKNKMKFYKLPFKKNVKMILDMCEMLNVSKIRYKISKLPHPKLNMYIYIYKNI